MKEFVSIYSNFIRAANLNLSNLSLNWLKIAALHQNIISSYFFLIHHYHPLHNLLYQTKLCNQADLYNFDKVRIEVVCSRRLPVQVRC